MYVIIFVNYLAPESLSENQIASIQKSLAEKKEQVDHEVKKTGGIFTKFNKFYHLFAKVKTCILVVLSLYHFFGGSGDSPALPIILSLVMSAILLKKSTITKTALKKNNHSVVRKIFRKTIALAVLFIFVYLLWASVMFDFFKSSRQVPAVDREIVKKELLGEKVPQNIEFPNLSYVRIGGAGARFGEKFERQSMKSLSSEKKRDQIYEQNLREKHSFLFNLPKELPLYFAFGFLTFFIIVKFALFFSHFQKYKNTLKKQEKILKLIQHFQTVRVPFTQAKAIEEEKNVAQDYPVITEEETVRLSSLSDISMTDNRILLSSEEPSYPVIAPPPALN